MNALAPLPLAPLPGSLAFTEPEIEAVRDFAEAQHAASTRECYDRDWRIFLAWCAARHASPLPAEPATVAAFLASKASLGGVKASGISRRLAAIRYAHRLAGVVDSPTSSEMFRATLRGIRSWARRPTRKPRPRRTWSPPCSATARRRRRSAPATAL